MEEFFFFIKKIKKKYLAVAALCLHCCTGLSLVVVSGDYSLVEVCGLLIAVASLFVDHKL